MELYFYDPFVTDQEYGAIMQDAYERDILEKMALEFNNPTEQRGLIVDEQDIEHLFDAMEDSVSIRRDGRAIVVIVNGKIEKSFYTSLHAELYVKKNYGHVPLVRRAY